MHYFFDFGCGGINFSGAFVFSSILWQSADRRGMVFHEILFGLPV